MLHRKLAISLLSACVVFGLLEGGLRVAGVAYPPDDAPLVLWDSDNDRMLQTENALHHASVRQLWEPRPLAEVPEGSAQGERICADSHRGPERALERAPGLLRIAALGDSSTFGMNVPYADTYCAQLEALLVAQGVSAEVLDFGVIGSTIRQGLERYDERVRAWQPDIVIEAFGAYNDHVSATDYDDKTKIERSVARAGWSSRAWGWLRERSRCVHAAALAADGLRGGKHEIRKQWFAHWEHQTAIRNSAGALDFAGVRRVPLEDFESCLRALRASAQSDGAELIAISMPRLPAFEERNPMLLEYSAAVERVAGELGIPCVDARADFRDRKRWEQEAQPLLCSGDPLHPSRAGHARIAAALLEPVLAIAHAKGLGAQ